MCASSSAASGRKAVSGSALGGGRGGCGLM